MAWLYADNQALSDAERRQVIDSGRSGKWLLYIDAAEVEDAWTTIEAATLTDHLGWAAKVATKRIPGKPVLICVYTRDWNDRIDVTRVLAALRDLGFAGRLSYKEDAATNAHLYGKGASLYVAQPGETSVSQRRNGVTPGDLDP